MSWTQPRPLCTLFGAGGPAGSGEEGLAWQKQARSSCRRPDQGHEMTSFFVRYSRQNRLGRVLGAPRPHRLDWPGGIDAIGVGLIALLYEVSKWGTAMDRSHAAGWRS
jgi:hypothetical protein